jgi:hypothetical protein
MPADSEGPVLTVEPPLPSGAIAWALVAAPTSGKGEVAPIPDLRRTAIGPLKSTLPGSLTWSSSAGTGHLPGTSLNHFVGARE